MTYRQDVTKKDLSKKLSNANIMLNLNELALKATQKNVVKSSKKESVNESLVRILLDDAKKLTRTQLISQISLDRLIAEHTKPALEKMTEAEFKSLITPVNKTVKNGLDTSISHSNNNSSFSYNDKYSHLELNEVAGLWTIKLKAVKA